MKYDFGIDMSENTSLSLLLRKIQPNSIVLEFGTATGYMTRMLKERLHCSVWGVEIDPEAACVAAQYCSKMIVADLDAMTWPEELDGQKFDYILFADVLEHLRDPWKVLQTAVSFLQPDGYVLTSIPNISHNAVVMELLQGNFEYRPLGLLDDTHIRFFTRKSVVKLLEQAGLLPIEWMNTLAKPENTEIAQDPDLFTKTFQTLMACRPDGEVYQFVTVSQKRKAIEHSKTASPYQADYLHSNLLQIYWEEAAGFSENCSATVALDNSDDFFEYRLSIPATATGRIRLDPGSKPAYIDIKRIALYEQAEDLLAEKPIVEWSSANSYAGLEPIGGVVLLHEDKEPQYRMITLHNDPQLLLTNINLANYSCPMSIKVIMRLDYNSVKKTLLPLALHYQEIVRKKEHILAQKDLEIGELHNIIRQKETEIETLVNSTSWKITAPLRKIRHRR